MPRKEKIYCNLFKCPANKLKGNICCYSCQDKENCLEKCFNSPEKCKEAYKYNK